jgi:hypothetical protein
MTEKSDRILQRLLKDPDYYSRGPDLVFAGLSNEDIQHIVTTHTSWEEIENDRVVLRGKNADGDPSEIVVHLEDPPCVERYIPCTPP